MSRTRIGCLAVVNHFRRNVRPIDDAPLQIFVPDTSTDSTYGAVVPLTRLYNASRQYAVPNIGIFSLIIPLHTNVSSSTGGVPSMRITCARGCSPQSVCVYVPVNNLIFIQTNTRAVICYERIRILLALPRFLVTVLDKQDP